MFWGTGYFRSGTSKMTRCQWNGIMHDGYHAMLIAKYYRLPVDPLLLILAAFAVTATTYVVRSIVKNRRR